MGSLIEPPGCVWPNVAPGGVHWPSAEGKRSSLSTWRSWESARRRCHDPDYGAWQDYGGRGITMCPEWFVSFDAFLACLGPRPEGYTLERIDVDKGYEPGNVRWATPTEQARNRRGRQQIATGLTPGQIRLAAANFIRMRTAEEKLARRLRERGWTCTPPRADENIPD